MIFGVQTAASRSFGKDLVHVGAEAGARKAGAK